MLGLEARDGQLRLDPSVPEQIGHIRMRGLHAFGVEWDVEAVGGEGTVVKCESPANAGLSR
jgi:hypothetical protein